MMKILLFCACFSFLNISYAQVYLQLEKYGSTKVKRFQVGDEVTFRLKGKEQDFRTEYIEQILLKEQIVVFSNGMTPLDNIDALRSFKHAHTGKLISGSLSVFGGSWAVFSLVDWAYGGNDLNSGALLVPATAFLSGWLTKYILRHRTYKIGKRRRLRLLDLRVW